MNQDKQVFLNQLDALILTMTQVVKTKGSVIMGKWITKLVSCGTGGGMYSEETKENSTDKVEHFCGTVACVCGHQVVSNRLDAFPEAAKSAYEYKEHTAIVSAAVAYELKEASAYFLGSPALAKSIIHCFEESRLVAAMKTEVFSKEELRSFNHLHLREPTPTDVVDYLLACRKKVQEKT